MANWKIDTTHSEVLFKVKHLVISTVTGAFTKFDAEASTLSDTDFEEAKVRFSAAAGSIDTKNAQRDEHLRSDDFFSAEKFPMLSFESRSFARTGADTFDIKGTLTIRDVKKEVVLKATLGGIAKDPYGQTKAGFEIEGKINRKEFGLAWSAATEAGGLIVGDEVKLLINAQLVKV